MERGQGAYARSARRARLNPAVRPAGFTSALRRAAAARRKSRRRACNVGADHRDGRTDGRARIARPSALRDRSPTARCGRRHRLHFASARRSAGRIADRMLVMRDGRVVTQRAASELTTDEIIAAMVGRRLESHFPELPDVPADAPVRLGVRDLQRAGLSQSTSASRCVPARSSDWPVSSARAEPGSFARSPAPTRPRAARCASTAPQCAPGRIGSAIAAGIAFITEDRKAQGLALGMTVRENMTLAHLSDFVDRDLLVDLARERTATRRMIDELQIRTPGTEQSRATFRAGRSKRSSSRSGCSARRALSLRRADARNRHRCEERNLPPDGGACAARRGDRDGFERPARSARDVAPRPGDSRQPDRWRSLLARRRRPIA